MTNNNNINFINEDFNKYNFNDNYDLIIFSYVLHHMNDPIEALKKAKNLLSNNGNIIFSVPGINYLKEIFFNNELKGKYSISDIYYIIDSAGLYPLSICRNDFLMRYNSYEMFINYLKSIGTYKKINDYQNESWNEEFNKKIMLRFNDNNSYITGE